MDKIEDVDSEQACVITKKEQENVIKKLKLKEEIDKIKTENEITEPITYPYSNKNQWMLTGEKNNKIHAWFIEYKRKNKLLFWQKKEWITQDMRENLHYKSTPLETYSLNGTNEKSIEKDYPLLYNQVCDTWRQLVDVRFKLLGLVPAISAALIYSILSSDKLNKWETSLIAVIGFLITLGIKIYDQRNSELHDQLISRGRKIEEEMGVDNGVFMGRRKSSKYFISIGRLKLIKIQHDTGLRFIYWTTLIVWIAVIVGVWKGWIDLTSSESLSHIKSDTSSN